ncbi:hypothetical protein [Nonomuraea sp. NPDC050643]|uniref:hypothetical protein n=1 Tax=Nonomuraea sp. NPDC050643 TaxID=3155660 RepID=UPI0033FDC08C
MAARKVFVRSRINGQVAEVAPQALRHFPDYERIDAPEAVFVEPAPSAESATPKPSTSRTTAAKTPDKE